MSSYTTTAQTNLALPSQKSAGKVLGFCLLLSFLAHGAAMAFMPEFNHQNIITQNAPLQINMMSIAAPTIEPHKIEPASGESAAKTPDIIETPKAKTVIAKPKPITKKAEHPQKTVKKIKALKVKAQPQQTQATNNGIGADKTTVIPVIKNADILKQTPPTYPARARRMGKQGTVILHALITPTGRTQNLKIVLSSGHSSLDNAAVNAVKTWQFAAAKKDGQTINAWVEVPVRFVLR